MEKNFSLPTQLEKFFWAIYHRACAVFRHSWFSQLHGPSSFFPWSIFGHSWSALFPFPRPSHHVIRTPTHHPRSKWSPSWRRCSGEFGPEPNLTKSVREQQWRHFGNRFDNRERTPTVVHRRHLWPAIGDSRDQVSCISSCGSYGLFDHHSRPAEEKEDRRSSCTSSAEEAWSRTPARVQRAGADVSRRGSGIPAGRRGGSALHPLAE